MSSPYSPLSEAASYAANSKGSPLRFGEMVQQAHHPASLTQGKILIRGILFYHENRDRDLWRRMLLVHGSDL